VVHELAHLGRDETVGWIDGVDPAFRQRFLLQDPNELPAGEFIRDCPERQCCHANVGEQGRSKCGGAVDREHGRYWDSQDTLVAQEAPFPRPEKRGEANDGEVGHVFGSFHAFSSDTLTPVKVGSTAEKTFDSMTLRADCAV